MDFWLVSVTLAISLFALLSMRFQSLAMILRHTFGATSVKFVAHLALFERLIRSSQASKICTGQLLMIKFESQIRWAKIFAMIHESIIWALVAPLRRHLASLP